MKMEKKNFRNLLNTNTEVVLEKEEEAGKEN